MSLLSLLKDRYQQAEKFTKEHFIDDIKRSIDDYEAKEMNLTEVVQSSGMDAINKRYEFVIPLIFTNTEAMKASLWDRLPDLLITGRGKLDEDKKRKVTAAYEYLKDKLDLETFAFQASHWFILGGFVTAHGSFKSETYEAPMFDQMGQPMTDATGQPQMQTLYSYNDPVLDLGDPTKEYYSSESEFSVDAKKIPFQFHIKMMTLEEIKKTYGVDVDSDAMLDIKGYEKKDKEGKDDIKRAKVYFYEGTIPEDLKDEKDETGQALFTDWESGADYYIIYTEKKHLYIEKRGDRLCKMGKWYGTPSSFFGFGLGKIGRQFQKEKSIRRGQQIRLADVAAFPKITIKNDGTNDVDIKSFNDPRVNTVVLYTSEKPEYMQPGNLAEVVSVGLQQAEQDAQQAFGLMDISQGAQNSSTVNTATGQSIFAEAAEKRVRLAKKNFMKFYQAVVIMLLKLAQENWDEKKLFTITDENGQSQEVEVGKEDLQGIDFDKDIEVDAESASVNKDIVREQYISLYDKVKDDPLIDRKAVFSDMVRNGFNQKDPQRYLRKSDLQPGMTLMGQDGQQYVVDKSGEVVSAQAMQQTAKPSGQDTTQTQGALLGSGM